MTFTIAPMKMTMTVSYHPLRIAAESSPEKSNASAAEK
jgi:hypothetical protein